MGVMSFAADAIEGYLSGLPEGVDSYRGYEQKGSIFREFMKGFAASKLLAELPLAAAALVRTPPAVSQWVPEVHANVVWVAARAALFESDEAFSNMAYQQNLRLISSPLYSILFRLVSPERILKTAASRWGQFHRGITIAAPIVRGREVTLEMRAPPGLLPTFLAKAYSTGFRAALEAAGGRAVVVELATQSSSGFSFHGTWE